MSFALLFAVLMLLWLFFGVVSAWPASGTGYRPIVSPLLLFVLLLLLGWKVFGPLIHP